MDTKQRWWCWRLGQNRIYWLLKVEDKNHIFNTSSNEMRVNPAIWSNMELALTHITAHRLGGELLTRRNKKAEYWRKKNKTSVPWDNCYWHHRDVFEDESHMKELMEMKEVNFLQISLFDRYLQRTDPRWKQSETDLIHMHVTRGLTGVPATAMSVPCGPRCPTSWCCDLRPQKRAVSGQGPTTGLLYCLQSKTNRAWLVGLFTTTETSQMVLPPPGVHWRNSSLIPPNQSELENCADNYSHKHRRFVHIK